MNLYSFNASGPDASNEPAFVEQLRLQVELSSNLSAFYENHELYTWSVCDRTPLYFTPIGSL